MFSLTISNFVKTEVLTSTSTIGSTVHFQTSFCLRAQIVDWTGTRGRSTPLGFIEDGGGLRAMSRRWKYAPETSRAMMMMDWMGYRAAREATATRGLIMSKPPCQPQNRIDLDIITSADRWDGKNATRTAARSEDANGTGKGAFCSS